jgi:hypothetical protein
MRKTITMLLTAGLVVGAFSAPMADAAKRKKKKQVIRKASATYDTPAIGHPDVGVVCSGANGCATFAIGAKERFAAFNVTDDAGQPVYVNGGQDLDGDNLADTSFSFCGKTDKPVPVEPGYAINLFISAGPGGAVAGAPCAGVGTSGTVDGLFSNKTFKAKF